MVKTKLKAKVGRWISFVSVLLCLPATAVINPGLQPPDLYDRYRNVFIAEVTRVHPGTGLTITVKEVLKGEYKTKQEIQLVFADGIKGELKKLKPGAPIAALAGGKRRRREKRFMLYLDGFFLGQMQDLKTWNVDSGDVRVVDGKPIPTLAGTWNGSTEQLCRMLRDARKGTVFFPRYAYCRFKPDQLIADFGKHPVHGVALYDIDRDGDLDIFACSPGGDRLYLQVEALEFADVTQATGLQTKSRSVAIADVDGDNLPDLLLDGMLYHGRRGDQGLAFAATTLIPALDPKLLRQAVFAEINGDGHPDVLASLRRGGVKAFLNPDKPKTPFVDATATLGLADKANGAGLDGLISVGDWNDDGKADLFYAAGKGFLLVQQDGKFSSVPQELGLRFTSGNNDETGMTGSGCFMPLLQAGKQDLLLPVDAGWKVIENRNGTPVDVTEHGNEISEGSFLHLASVGADLNVDGYLDFYTISRAANGHNRLILNRGYGSFMLGAVNKYYKYLVRGPTHKNGGLGVATGDVNGDGAPDLLIGNGHGKLALLVNETLDLRKPVEHPTADIAKLLQTKLLTVHVHGPRGVVGTRLLVTDKQGRALARRDLGVNLAAGSWGPDSLTIAIREPAAYKLTVRYADGKAHSTDVDLRQDARVTVEATRKGLEIGW